LQRKAIYRTLEQLVELNIAVFEEELIEKYKPKLATYIQLAPGLIGNDQQLKQVFEDLERKAPRQVQVLMAYFMITKVAAPILKATLLEQSKSTEAAISSLVTKQVFVQFKEEISRLHKVEEQEFAKEIQLTTSQSTALEQLQEGLAIKPIQLLHGATGSGKTLIYIELIKAALAT